MPDDPRINWELASQFGILVDEPQDAWWSGHVTDILELDQGSAGVLIGTEMGGVWSVPPAGTALPLSNSWNHPNVNCLAAGPDGPRHFFAGCDGALIYETDTTAAIPLLAWLSVTGPLPGAAGDVKSIAILRNHRRIIAACDGGVYWSHIPPASPPATRASYFWTRAEDVDSGQGGYYSIAIGSLSGHVEHPGDEELDRVSVIAGANNAGVFTGLWRDPNTLTFRRAKMLDDNGVDVSDWGFAATGRTSVTSCQLDASRLYAACAQPDGRLKMVLGSSDGGRHWKITGFKLLGVPGGPDMRNYAGDGGHQWNNCIHVMPDNPDLLAVGWLAGVLISADGGRRWQLINNNPHLHVDLHVVRLKPVTAGDPRALYIGSDGGLARVDLDDFFATGKITARSDYNRMLPTLQCYSTYPIPRQFYGTLSISPRHPTRGWVSMGVQDNGNIYTDLSPASPWRLAATGDGGWNAFVGDGGLIHCTMSGKASSAFRFGTVPPLLQGTGIPPVTVPPPTDAGGIKDPVGDVVRKPRYRNAQGQPMYAVAGSGSNVYGLFPDQIEDQPMTYHWELLGTLPDGGIPYGVASHTGKTIYIGTWGGRIFSLDTASKAITELSVSLPKPDPNQPQTGGAVPRIATLSDTVAFAILNGTSLNLSYIIRLNGTEWSVPISAGLPIDQSFYGLDAILHDNRRVVFASTDDRVYMSEDSGDNWVQISGGLPRRSHCAELRLAVDREQSWLYLSTFGRSLWRADLHRMNIG